MSRIWDNKETRFHYRDNIVDELGEMTTTELEQAYKHDFDNGGVKSDSYVRHATNGKPVVTGPFRAYIAGFVYAKERTAQCTNS